MHLENLTPFDAQATLAFDTAGREMVVAVCKASFDFPAIPDAECPVSEQQVPLQMADELSTGPAMAPIVETDFVPFKPFCDIVVVGPAQAPGGRPVQALAVDVQLGSWGKAFHVIGPRVWQKRYASFAASDPLSFVTQAIGYEQAWGGSDPHPTREGHFATIETNPAGVGYYRYTPDVSGKPLPNTQQIGRNVDAVTGDYVPMALGPIGRAWMPRRLYAGTYDEAWKNNRMPFPPLDLDARYFQSTAPDQQIAYPKGGEPFRLRGLAAEGEFVGQLPNRRLAFRYVRKSGRITQKVGNLDTVVFMPAARKLTLTWRAHLVLERDLFDLKEIVVMSE
jgi:hypothetical protein